jgi:DNA repair protein RecO (recombination protein O)
MVSGISTEAVILASTDVGEEDRILTFLTPDMGLVRAAATSARNLKKGRAASLDLFTRTRLTISIPLKEGRLKRIGTADIISAFMGIRSDYGRLCAASYIGQTIAHCIQEEDPSPGTWELVLYCFSRLDGGAEPFNVMLPFEVRVLKELGILPELFQCLVCSTEVVGEVCMDPRGGGVVHRHCSSVEYGQVLSAGDLAVLRYISGKGLAGVDKLQVPEDEAKRLFHIVHSFSVHHLGYEAKALGMLGR